MFTSAGISLTKSMAMYLYVGALILFVARSVVFHAGHLGDVLGNHDELEVRCLTPSVLGIWSSKSSMTSRIRIRKGRFLQRGFISSSTPQRSIDGFSSSKSLSDSEVEPSSV